MSASIVTPESLTQLLTVVRAATEEAATLVRAAYRKPFGVEHKGPVDLVTEYDRRSEQLLRERLAPTGIPIVGEEAGGEWDRDRPAFFVDPIDGTTNFVHGHPFWCVSVGLVVDALPVLGVVIAPVLGVEWYGWLTGDARVARRVERVSGPVEDDCKVSGVARFTDALLATGFPYERKNSVENNFDAFVAIKSQCQAVRRCGSAALDLCLVADGTYEGYWERRLRPWDIAGGSAIVHAAGGKVTDFDAQHAFLHTGDVVATNGPLHQELIDELARIHSSRSLMDSMPPSDD